MGLSSSSVCWKHFPGSREEEEQGRGHVLACTVVCLVGKEKF